MSAKHYILYFILIALCSWLIFDKCNVKEQPIIEIDSIRDSIADVYKEKYKAIDSIEIRQETVYKYRTKIIKQYDTILSYINFDSKRIDSGFANYKPI